MADGPNLFVRLHKWAVRQDENFLTESLAVVLEHLLLLAPAVGTRLVSRLTGGFIDVLPDDASAIEIRTQVEVEAWRPDLEIRVPGRLTWVEVKNESELRAGQLEGYRIGLTRSGVPETRLVLLTRYPEAYRGDAARPDTEFRWFELVDWLESERAHIDTAGDVATFLARQFLGFLKERDMILTHVGKYMPEGLRALRSLVNMLFEAAHASKVSVRHSAGFDFIGVFLDDSKYWVGILLTDPEKLWFATRCRIDREAAAKLPEGELEEEGWVPGRWRWWRGVQLDSEEVHFFERTKVSQIEWLEGFMRDCLQKARSIETPDQPPIPEQPEEA